MSDRLMNTREAAEMLGIATSTLDTWRSDGRPCQPPYVKFGTARKAPVRYRRADVEAWLETQRVDAA